HRGRSPCLRKFASTRAAAVSSWRLTMPASNSDVFSRAQPKTRYRLAYRGCVSDDQRLKKLGMDVRSGRIEHLLRCYRLNVLPVSVEIIGRKIVHHHVRQCRAN